jgi:hypothetical protein
MLTIVTPAASTRLTTIEAARAQAGIGADVADATVEDWIDQASAAIVSSCRRPFARETVLDLLRPRGAGPLILSRSNLVAAPVLTVGGVTLTDDDVDVDLGAGLIWRLYGYDRGGWPCGLVRVTYTAGWLLPGETGRDLPADVEQACLILLAARNASQGRDPMLRSETIEGVGSSSWIATADMGSLPPQAAGLLQPYIRYAVG